MGDKTTGHKYGVSHLAKELGIEPAYVRTKLRNSGVKVNKTSGVYGWDSQSDFKSVVAKLKPADKKAAAKKPAAKKPAAKKSAKEAA